MDFSISNSVWTIITIILKNFVGGNLTENENNNDKSQSISSLSNQSKKRCIFDEDTPFEYYEIKLSKDKRKLNHQKENKEK